MARIKDENESTNETDFQFESDVDFENYNKQMDERKNSYARNFIPSMEIDKECAEILLGKQKSLTLYSKQKQDDVNLEDFDIKKVIG